MPADAPVLPTEIDLADEDLYALGDPAATWTQLRRRGEAYWNTRADGSGFWAITRYQDAVRVLKDSATFRSEGGMRLDHNPAATEAAAGRLMIVTDGPRHIKMRRLIASAFTPRMVARLEHNMRAVVREQLAPVESGVPFEFTDVAATLPVAVICDLLGVPEGDWAFMLARTRTAFGAADADPMDRLAAHADILDYYEGLVDDRRREPQDDVISALANGLVDGVALTDEEVFLNCDGLISGGNETSRHAAVGGLLALLRHPGQWRTAAGAPEVTDAFVNEVLRYTSPALHVLRTPSATVEVAGRTIRAGEPVTVWMPAANRDENAFPDPERFDVTRTPNNHIAFGAGTHHCIGATLARTELRVLFSELLHTFHGGDTAGPVRRLRSNLIWGFESAPVVLNRR